jgi:RND family efflux transporter MFP subunit
MKYIDLLLLAASSLTATASFCGCNHGEVQKAAAVEPEEQAGIKVRAMPAAMRTIAERAAGLGHCEALPDHTAMLTAAAEGRVVELLVQPGGIVTQHREIVRLDTRLAEANLAEKKSAVDAQEASLKVLVSLPREIEQKSAKLAIEQAQLGVEKAQATVDHLSPLRQRGEVSESAFHEADVALRQAQLQLKTAETQFAVLMLRPRSETIEEGKTKVNQAQTALATAQAQLDQLTIRAPLAGVLDSLNCQIGQTLSVGSVVGQVVDAKQVYVVAWLSVSDARRVKVDAPAEVRPESIGKSTGKESESGDTHSIGGKVASIGAVTDPQTGNLPVRVLVDNNAGRLTLGQTAVVSISIEERNVLAVPAAAIFDLGEGELINVVRAGKTIVLKHFNVGRKDGDWVEVSNIELKAGEPVIVDGGYNLPEGRAVTIEKGEK